MITRYAHDQRVTRPSVSGSVRKLAVPIILGWLAITLLLSVGVPPLEQVAKQHPVALNSDDASSVKAVARMGKVFKDFDSGSMAMIVLEGDQPLGQAAHQYYNTLIEQPQIRHHACEAHPGLLG